MRLALITQDFPPKVGGVQTYSFELAKRFHQDCEFFCVIAPEVEGMEEVDAKQPFLVKRIKTMEPLLGWSAFVNVPDFIRKHAIDTVYHSQWNSLPISIWMKKAGVVKNIYTAAHGRELLFNPIGENKWSQFLYGSYRRNLLDKLDGFFPVSGYTGKLLEQEGIPKYRIKVVINGTDPQLFHPQDATLLKNKLGLKGKKVLLTITRLVARKGIDTVLRALPSILHKYPDTHYVIVGEGTYGKQLKAMSKKLRIADSVTFTGKIPFNQLNQFYNMSELFVMPSKSEVPDVEGFGLVFLEANACGKPVVGAFSGGIPSAIIHEETGLLVEEQNPEALSESICRLLDDPEWASQLGRKGRERVKCEANWDRAAQKILKAMYVGFAR